MGCAVGVAGRLKGPLPTSQRQLRGELRKVKEREKKRDTEKREVKKAIVFEEVIRRESVARWPVKLHR